ncbi:hypothetical protein HWV62_6703 [Athelia sp. TMB]|nr:hypothetical protein HWV62_22750 [Athelia sp. TMB]KAF7976455.1 hypothetical protein HWV62_6703 [Athelia sp. TMB]
MGVLIQITFSFLFTLLLYAFYKVIGILRLQGTSPLRVLPGPQSQYPLLGNIVELLTSLSNVTALIEKWFKQHGSTYKFHGLLNTYGVATKDNRALAHILNRSDIYQKPNHMRQAVSRILGEGLLFAEGEGHRRQRKIMNPAFGPAQIKALTGVFTEKANLLCDRITECISPENIKGTRVDVLSWLSKATLDVIGQAGFNYRFNTLDPSLPPNELNVLLTELSTSGQEFSILRTLQEMFHVLRFIPSEREKQITRAKKALDEVGQELLATAKVAVAADETTGSGLEGRDLLTLLIKANQQQGAAQKLSDDDVLGQVPTFLIAGHETTSTATAWTLFALAQHHAVQSRLREECLSLSTDTPTMDQLDKLNYLECVIREAMRLYPPVPCTMRRAMLDDVIPLEEPFMDAEGVEHHSFGIPKGTDVIIMISPSNSAPDFWGPDAASFRPERWEADSGFPIPEGVPGVWGNQMSFLGGTRGCIGFRFAVVEMKALLYALIRAFEFDLAVPAAHIVPKVSLVANPTVSSEPAVGQQMPLLVKPFHA